jgi:cell division protein ZapA (FtsZ GTPase activity inhibitor)
MESSGAPGKTTVRVTIFNQTYNLLATGEPGEIEAVAQTVNDLMCAIAARAGNIDSTRIAVLTSMHLADQLRTLEKELENLRGRVDRKSREFAELLDTVVD